ncbi:MAG TPA: hypothetical protein VGP08_23595 [Pyrinomonadaceae bacterium]|jgi:hypothetical protein|nr:hypothetical protein [Pyrinomonadaceae bacterium]
MNEHLIVYVDTLGTKDAIKSSDETKTAALIELLNRAASLRGESDLRTEAVGMFNLSHLRPAVSTFSDHIVMSYPTEDLHRVDKRDGLGSGLLFARNEIALLAAAAMNDGFLIRGGATVGPLYHAGGVVLGPAMVEAYELESRHAMYPRIAVSRKLYDRVKFEPRIQVLLTDHDRITHLNYFTEMVLRSNQIEESRAVWLDKARKIMEKNIARFERKERWNELGKWVWFEKQLEQASKNAAPLIV